MDAVYVHLVLFSSFYTIFNHLPVDHTIKGITFESHVLLSKVSYNLVNGGVSIQIIWIVGAKLHFVQNINKGIKLDWV